MGMPNQHDFAELSIYRPWRCGNRMMDKVASNSNHSLTSGGSLDFVLKEYTVSF